MKYRVVDLLCCPRCGGDSPPLTLLPEKSATSEDTTTFKELVCGTWCSFKQVDVKRLGRASGTSKDKSGVPCNSCFSEEIVSGSLECPSCSEVFKITRGVPRMLLGALREDSSATNTSKKEEELLATQKSFGYQWQEYDEMYGKYRDYFLDFMQPFSQDYFDGKLILDAGCGFGRFAYFANEFGGEVVGLDLSGAVDSAYKNNLSNPQVHIIQGNIYELPLRKAFDLIYCLGVIQHLPEKEAGFRALVNLRAKKTTLFFWVYGKRFDIYRLIDLVRPITTRMPFWLLNPLCFSLALLQVILFNIPYWILKGIGLKKVGEKIPYHRYAQYPFRHNVADWFDRLSVPLTAYFSREDLEGWFKNAKIENFKIIPRGYGWRAWTPSEAPQHKGNQE